MRFSGRIVLFSARMKTPRGVYMLLAVCWILVSCNTTKPVYQPPGNSINKEWEKLDLFSRLHTGLSIYEYGKDNWLFRYHDDNYFTPASCTKLLTMYTALRYLDDQVRAAYYKIKGDTVIVWGGGDPGTLFPDIHAPSEFMDFLKTTNKTIVFSDATFTTTGYGKGWAWDDYGYNFMVERTPFPIYGNRLWIDRKQDTISTTPQYFKQLLHTIKDTSEIRDRNKWGTEYSYHFDPMIHEANGTIPISFFENDMRLIWTEAIGKDILWKTIPFPGNTATFKGTARDTLIKIMMQASDNFIAEQLLLASSMKEIHQMNEGKMIELVLKGPLGDLPDSIQWVDGSGLSRYNQITPRSLVSVLRQIIKLKGLDFVKAILPAGGLSGTISSDFKGVNGRPYIFAKSGTLRNTYCLTGILLTKSGRVLLFSWMNNDVPGDTGILKLSMEHLFNYLRDNY